MKKLTLTHLEPLPYSAEEAMNRLRVNFNFCGDRFKKIIITSSTPNEGKSFVSSNLWRLLAASGARVVLVDADIRKSVLRSRYQISYGDENQKFYGLSHYLAGQVELEDVLYETNLSDAYLLPTTHTVNNPAILLQNPRFALMLEKLSQLFDYVLIDTPPLSNVADGDLIAAQCDGGILVVRSGVTPRGLIASSLKQLDRAGCELMGVVLNRVETKNNPYYYKYGKYGYYSSYYGGYYGSTDEK